MHISHEDGNYYPNRNPIGINPENGIGISVDDTTFTKGILRDSAFAARWPGGGFACVTG